MRPVRWPLTAVTSAFLFFALATQSPGQNTPEPKRWTAPPTTIESPATQRVESGTVFPDFVPRAGEIDTNEDGEASGDTIAGPAVTVSASLAVVLGLFAALVWMTRRFGGRGMSQGALPKEIVQSLGSTALDPRTRVTMLRCGGRILVVAQTATGIHPLSEITDPEEVRQLTAACLGDAKQSFVSTLKSIEKEPVRSNFTGSESPPEPKRKRSRLFASA